MNENCGAGELKPTDSWTWDEAEKSEHIMIKSLEIKSAGQIIAAALDGDGDRCFLIESTEDGCKVVDGDEMADQIQDQQRVIGTLLLVLNQTLLLHLRLVG